MIKILKVQLLAAKRLQSRYQYSKLSRTFSRLPRFGRESDILSAFRTFVRFALVWFCLFFLPLGVWEGLRLVLVAVPGLSLTFFTDVILNEFIYLSKPEFYGNLNAKGLLVKVKYRNNEKS